VGACELPVGEDLLPADNELDGVICVEVTCSSVAVAAVERTLLEEVELAGPQCHLCHQLYQNHLCLGLSRDFTRSPRELGLGPGVADTCKVTRRKAKKNKGAARTMTERIRKDSPGALEGGERQTAYL